MGNKVRLGLYLTIGLATLIPISALFFQELGALPRIVRLLATVFTIGIIVLATYLMRTHVRHLGTNKLVAVALAIALVAFASLTITRPPSIGYANLIYSDGSHTEHAKPSQIDGRTVDSYILHPQYGSVRVCDSLIGDFPSNPKALNVLFSKPQWALLKSDGTPTMSDGISVEINIFNSIGQLDNGLKFYITQEEFLKSHWVEKKITAPSGISTAKIKIGSGPPGSTPYNDTTLVAFEERNLNNYLLVYGKIILVGFAFLSVALFAVFTYRDFFLIRVSSSPWVLIRRVFPYLVLIVLLITFAYWSARKTSFVYFWDYRNYWQKTETLHEMMISGAWRQAVGVFSYYFSADYSMLPAVLPATVSLFTGYPTRLNYLLTITAIYAVPAYITVAYLAKRLLECSLTPPLNNNRNTWVFSSLPIFFGIPVYFGVTLNLMPDIGGVVIFVAALLQASSLMKEIANEPDNNESWKTTTGLLRSSLGLGIFISLMFLFRRWYVFAAVGIACSCIILVLIESWIKRKYLHNIVQRIYVALVFISFSALPFLSWVLFDWTHNIGQHDYANLYSSYKNTLGSDLNTFVFRFGLVAPTLCIVFIALARWLNLNRYLMFILVTSSIIASLLFLQVQSPGPHHFYLLMPLLGASLAVLSIALFRFYGIFAALFFSIILMLGSVSATWISQGGDWIGFIFPKYTDWLPKQQRYAKGFDEIAKWLILKENEKFKFCVIASSAYINQDIFSEIWQILPEVKKNSFDGRLVHLGQVDSQNGPPNDGIKQCDISLVGVPFQTHLKAGEQLSLQIVQEEIISGTGVGAAFGRDPKVFFMDDNTKILAYFRTREITDKEYANLVERFLNSKGSSYLVPQH